MALSTANHFAVFIDSKKYLEKVQWTKGISSGTGLYLSANGKLQVSKTMETFSRYYQVQNFKLLKGGPGNFCFKSDSVENLYID